MPVAEAAGAATMEDQHLAVAVLVAVETVLLVMLPGVRVLQTPAVAVAVAVTMGMEALAAPVSSSSSLRYRDRHMFYYNQWNVLK
jgi:hypothetical protein